MRRTRRTGGLAALVATALIAAGCGGAAPVAGDSGARVERVVDGDTIVVEVDGGQQRVRLLGLDAPESAIPDAPVECFGPEAARRARELMAPGTLVEITVDPRGERTDEFDRLLAYVRPAGKERTINERLVAEGYATVFAFRDRRFTLRPALEAAERRARRRGAGLWSACAGGGANAGRPATDERDDSPCPADRPIKGNLPSGIYHRPGDEDYAATNPERCFATDGEAEAEGFRAAGR